MANIDNEDNLESIPSRIFEIPGEPALVIDGVPPVSTSDGSIVLCEISNDKGSDTKNVGFGDWFVGREVQKLFGENLFNGKVTEFDKKSGWYRVVYEDGDFEDMEWHELQEVLLPLDVTIPMEKLASRVIKKMQKAKKSSVKSASRSKNHNKAQQQKEQSLRATDLQSDEGKLSEVNYESRAELPEYRAGMRGIEKVGEQQCDFYKEGSLNGPSTKHGYNQHGSGLHGCSLGAF